MLILIPNGKLKNSFKNPNIPHIIYWNTDYNKRRSFECHLVIYFGNWNNMGKPPCPYSSKSNASFNGCSTNNLKTLNIKLCIFGKQTQLRKHIIKNKKNHTLLIKLFAVPLFTNLSFKLSIISFFLARRDRHLIIRPRLAPYDGGYSVQVIRRPNSQYGLVSYFRRPRRPHNKLNAYEIFANKCNNGGGG